MEQQNIAIFSKPQYSRLPRTLGCTFHFRRRKYIEPILCRIQSVVIAPYCAMAYNLSLSGFPFWRNAHANFWRWFFRIPCQDVSENLAPSSPTRPSLRDCAECWCARGPHPPTSFKLAAIPNGIKTKCLGERPKYSAANDGKYHSEPKNASELPKQWATRFACSSSQA